MYSENKTRGQLESEISTAITQFEREYLGRGPKEARTFIIEDMVLIRLKGVLTPAEEHLAKQTDGASLIKQVRMRLIDGTRPVLEKIISDKTSAEVISLHTDISAKTGERIFVFTMSRKL